MRQSLAEFARGIVSRFLFWVPGVVLALSDLYEQHIRMQLPDWARPEVKIDPSVGLWLIALGVLWAAFLTYHELHSAADTVRGRLIVDAVEASLRPTSDGRHEIAFRLHLLNQSSHPIDDRFLPVLCRIEGSNEGDVDIPVGSDSVGTVPIGQSRFVEWSLPAVSGQAPYSVLIAYGVEYGISGAHTFRRAATVISKINVSPSPPEGELVWQRPTWAETKPVETRLGGRPKRWQPVLDIPKVRPR
jgi:hypothetical protein